MRTEPIDFDAIVPGFGNKLEHCENGQGSFENGPNEKAQLPNDILGLFMVSSCLVNSLDRQCHRIHAKRMTSHNFENIGMFARLMRRGLDLQAICLQ